MDRAVQNGSKSGSQKKQLAAIKNKAITLSSPIIAKSVSYFFKFNLGF